MKPKSIIILPDGTEHEMSEHDIHRLRFAVNARSRERSIDLTKRQEDRSA